MGLFKELLSVRLIEDSFVFLLNIFTKSTRVLFKFASNNNRVILVVCLHKIGDTIFTFPAIRELVEKKGENVNVLCYDEVIDLVELIIPRHCIYTINKKLFFNNGLIANSKARQLLDQIRPEIIIDLTCSIISASLIFRSGAKEIYGMNKKYFCGIYDKFLLIRNRPHLIDMYNEIISLFLKQPISTKYYAYKKDINSINRILIHPSAGWKAKEWKLINYIKLYEILKTKFIVKLIFQKGSIKNDIIEYLEAENINYIEINSLNKLINEIKKCSIFIGNDSGPLYLANFLGKYTFTIYGPTNPSFSMPFSKGDDYVRKLLRCSPNEEQYCFTFAGRFCPTHDCVNTLSLEEVKEKLNIFLENITNNTFLDDSGSLL